MAPVTISLTIPEADVARVQAAAESISGLKVAEGATAKQLLAGVVKQVVLRWERETHAFTPPGVE